MLNVFYRLLLIGIVAPWVPIHVARAQTQVRIPSQPRTIPQGSAIGGGVAPGTHSPASTPGIGAPTLDPYATSPNAASSPPTLFGTSPAAPRTFGASTQPLGAAPYNSAAATPNWPAFTNPSPTAGGAFPNTGYPATYSQQPSVLFPNGMNPGGNPAPGWQWPQPAEGRYLRLFQDVRFKHTWLSGGDGPVEVGVDESEVGTTVNFPNFLWSSFPIHVSPVFAMNWWDGPEVVRGTFPTDDVTLPFDGGFGLPSRVYAAYLSVAWQPQFTPQFSADIESSIGVYSDFQGITSDSVRIQGTGLGVLHLTPTTTLKLGVTYLDRVDIKLLPAGGIVWTPNPQTRWDIYFPRPKLARYLTTIGNTDIWFYVNGEYGGGSWTIGEEALDRRVDMNDIRVGGGFEWTHPFGLRGFVESAYVFERQLVFASGNQLEYDLDEAIMVRGGFVY